MSAAGAGGVPEEVARRLVEDVWNGAAEDAALDLVDPACPGGGPDGTLAWHRSTREAFPDLRYEVVAVVAAGDEVALRWHATGTQRGAFGPVPPTGRRVAYAGATFLRVRAGRVVDVWSVNEQFRKLEQLGVTFAPPAAGGAVAEPG